MSDRPGKQAVAALLAWFEARQRAMPWRAAPAGERAPYAVWVSEIMLQQTRVDVVVPYFETWMKRFPTVEALAEADEDEVLRHWAGLGYYRRARFLHRAAQALVAAGARGRGGSGWPRTAAEWKALSGVGEYTAAAVASLAFGEAAPVVDGNVKRVAARVEALALATDDRKLHRAAEAWMAAAMELLPEGGQPGAWNEAVMELGATVCSPRGPACELCPLEAGCQATALARAGKAELVEDYPKAPKPMQWKELELIYGLAVAPNEGGVLLIQRAEGWNPGLWEPPSLLADPDQAASSSVAEAWIQSGAPGQLAEELGIVRHTITRHKITARVHRLELPGDPAYQDPSVVGLTGLAKKILRRWV